MTRNDLKWKILWFPFICCFFHFETWLIFADEGNVHLLSSTVGNLEKPRPGHISTSGPQKWTIFTTVITNHKHNLDITLTKSWTTQNIKAPDKSLWRFSRKIKECTLSSIYKYLLTHKTLIIEQRCGIAISSRNIILFLRNLHNQ